MDRNLPDDCQGDSELFPWNEKDDPECPECGGAVIIDTNEPFLFEAHCTECEYKYWSMGDVE